MFKTKDEEDGSVSDFHVRLRLLLQVPLTFRVVAKPVPTFKSEVVKTPLRPPTPPPEKKVRPLTWLS